MAKKRRSTTCKIFKHGNSYVMSLPHQLVKALQINEGDKILVKLDDQCNLIVERHLNGDTDESSGVVQVRVIGGAELSGGLYKQLGFTVPLSLAVKIVDTEFAFPIIDVKKGEFFRIVFRNLGKVKEAPA